MRVGVMTFIEYTCGDNYFMKLAVILAVLLLATCCSWIWAHDGDRLWVRACWSVASSRLRYGDSLPDFAAARSVHGSKLMDDTDGRVNGRTLPSLRLSLTSPCFLAICLVQPASIARARASGIEASNDHRYGGSLIDTADTYRMSPMARNGSYYITSIWGCASSPPPRVQSYGSYWQLETRIGEARKPGPPGDIDDPTSAYDIDESDVTEAGDNHGMFSQLDEGLNAVLNVALARSLEQRAFVPSVAFRGARPGTMYTTGAQGLGYYRDTPLAERAASSPQTLDGPAASLPPVLIALSDLLCVDVDEAVPRRTRRRLKRIPVRNRGRRIEKIAWDGPHAETLAACSRFRAAGLWAFDTFNPNCGSRALDYLGGTAADACLFQEMKCRMDDLDQQARTAAGQGWRLACGPAKVTEKDGVSSGVAVAVLGHLGLAHPLKPLSPEADVSRVCVRWLGSVCRGGIHLISVYLRDTEGLSQANLDILHSVAAAISELQGPWLIAGDFNLEPALLRQSGWLQLVKGVVHAPPNPTCGLKTYDYFVSSDSLAFAVVGIANVVDEGSHPHTPVRLYLRAAPRAIMIRCLCKPTMFGADLPAGCLPAPPDYTAVAPAQGDVPSPDSNGRFHADFVTWVRKVEDELADICGLEGTAREAATGRGAGPRFALKPALGQVASPLPRVSAVTCAWRAVAAWLLQLLRALAVVQDPARQHDIKARYMISRVLKRFRLHAWPNMGTHEGAELFRRWFDGIQRERLYTKQYVVILRLEANQTAKAAAGSDVEARRRSWQAWLHEGPAAGLSRQHRMSRVAGGWVPSAIDQAALAEHEADGSTADAAEGMELRTIDRTEMPLHSQQEVEREATAWAIVWQADAQPPTPLWPAMLGESLPELCVTAAMHACAAFPSGTGLGWDNLHPRALRRISVAAITALLRIFVLAEMLGRWPEMMGIVVIALLPKVGGGNRPIGLCPSLVRLWMRLRLPVAQAWQSANDRPYFFAGEAKGADVAAWKQAARAEIGAYDGLDHALALLDIIKAFDGVPWDWLVKQAIAKRYNLWLLRLSIAVYALTRTIRCGKCYSAAVIARCGITAGGALATTELRVLLIDFLDYACNLSPKALLTVYVDDMTVEATAQERDIVEIIVAVLRFLVSVMVMLRMRLSDSKCVCCASSIRIGRSLVGAVPGLKLRFVPRVTSLGSALGAGRRRNVKVAHARLANFRARKARFKRLQKARVNVPRLMRTGGVAALTYGQAVTGVSNKLLLQQRRSVAAATVRTVGGGDLDLTLALADGSRHGRVDPAFEAHCQPIVFWAMAVWHEWLPKTALGRLIAAARARLARAKNPWAAVCGPAAAYVATASRLGWSVQGPMSVLTDDGVTLDFCVDSPAFVKAAVDESVRRWRGRNIGRRLAGADPDGLGLGPSLACIYRLLDPRRCTGDDDWGPRERAGLRSAVANRQWPQARLCRAGLAESPDCQFCVKANLLRRVGDVPPRSLSGCRDLNMPSASSVPLAPPGAAAAMGTADNVPIGTLVHRVWDCATIDQHRQRLVSPLLMQAYQRARSAGTADVAVWVRGLMPTEQAVPLAPEHADTFTWVIRPTDGWISGKVYTDGSMIDGPPYLDGLCRRLGWALVALDQAGNITASAYGAPATWIDTVYGAELWALWQAARLAAPGTSFRTDCLSVLQVFKSGQRAACSSSCKLARVWHGVFAAFDDQDTALVDIAWMQSHTTVADVGVSALSNGETLTADDRLGNEEADRLAKLAAALHRVPEHLAKPMAARMELARQLGRWIGQATAIAGDFAAPDGTTWRDSKPADRRVRAAQLRERQARQTNAAAVPAVPPQQRWASAVQVRAVAETSLRHDTHRIVVTGSVTWCDRCGAYAEIRGRGLARPCRGPVAGGNRVGRLLKDVQARFRALRAGKHPTSGVELESARPAHRSDHARTGPGRERSRSQRRANACRRLIAAISGVEPTPQPDAERPASASASVRQRSRRVAAPAARRSALCQLLIAAASTDSAASCSTEWSGGSWCGTIASPYASTVRVDAEARSASCPHAALGYDEELSLSYRLFVLGSSFNDGGWMQDTVAFDSAAVHAHTSLFMMVIVHMDLPSFLGAAHPWQATLVVSHYPAIAISAVYRQLLYILFWLFKEESLGDEVTDNGEETANSEDRRPARLI